jgi:hypothetical protein
MTVRVPEHVVFRNFPSETVVLNLQTGKYHGLNKTAGRMLELLGERGELEEVAVVLAEEYETPVDTVRQDLDTLCRDLLERNLIEVHEDGG